MPFALKAMTLRGLWIVFAAFLDISQAFDKVWHKGLLYKLRRSLPLNYYLIFNSYLSNRHFLVKVNTELTTLLTLVKEGFFKAVSSVHYYTYFIQQTFQPRLTPSLPPLPMILQSSPLTVILPLLPKNCKPPSSLFNPGYVICELKLMRLSRFIWHSLQDETRAQRSI
jgi:hypothetical protein